MNFLKALTDIHELQWINLALLILASLLSVVGVYLAGYARRKGENFATKEDFHEILRQLKTTTELTEQIKAQSSSQIQVGQSALAYRQAQLAEFYGPIYAILKTSKDVYDIWIQGKLREINKDVIDLFRKQNEEIVGIITTRAHLGR